MDIHINHLSKPENVAAVSKLAYENVWKEKGWQIVERKDGEWVAVGKKKRTKSSGSTVDGTQETSSEPSGESGD